MDPHVSDDDQSSSSADDCEVNVCAVSDDDDDDDDDVPLDVLRMELQPIEVLKREFQGTSQPQSSVGERVTEPVSFATSDAQPEASRKCQHEPLQLGSSIEECMSVKDGASPMRKRRRVSLLGSPGRVRRNRHEEDPVLLERETTVSSINDLLDSTSMSSSVLFAISDAVLGDAAGTSDETSDSAAVSADAVESCEAILIRESDSECSSDASVELLNIKKEPGQSNESINPRSTATKAFDAVKERSPLRTRKHNLAKLKRLRLGNVTKVEADSSATVVSDEEERKAPATESGSLDFKFKQEPYDSDDDSCLITKVVKKPCPLGNDKFGKCTLRCCNPAEYFYPDVMATRSKATNHKRKDLQITTVSSTSSCDHGQEKSTQEDTCWEQTAASSQGHASKDVCTIGTNTAPLKLPARKDYPSKQSRIGQYYFPKGKRPVSPSSQTRRLNLRSKKSGSYLERSLKTFSSLCEHHMAVSHKCFR